MNGRQRAGGPPEVQPAHGARAVVLLVALFAVTFLCQAVRMRYTGEWGDEGAFANGALRVLSDQVIYRDFQHNYPPGRVFSLALLIRLFGQDLLVVRLFWCLLHAAAASVCFLVARRLMTLPFAVLAALAVTLNVAHMNKSAELLFPGLVLLTLARLREGRASDFAAGVSLSAVALFRQDVGVVAIGLYALSLALDALGREASGETPLAGRLARRLRTAWPFGLGYGLLALPCLGYLWLHEALGAAFYDVAFSGFLGNQALARPFPDAVVEWSPGGLARSLISRGMLFYFPPLLYLACLALVPGMFRRGQQEQARLLLLTSLLGGALFLQVLPRSDWGHLQKAYVPAHLCSLFLVSRALAWEDAALRRGHWRRALGFLPVLALVVLVPVSQLFHSLRDGKSIWNARRNHALTEAVSFPHGELRVPRHVADDFRRLVFTVQRTRSSEPDWMLTFPAGGLFNFLFGIPTPLRYDMLRPGELRNNDPEVLAEIMQDFHASKPRYLLRTPETSNPELAERIHAASLADYRRIDARFLTLYVRE